MTACSGSDVRRRVHPDEYGIVALLVPGAWPFELEKLYDLTVASFPTSKARPGLWERLLRARRELGRVIATQLWVGGSFLSSKLEPGDLDLFAVLDRERFPPPTDMKLHEFLTNASYGLGIPLGIDLDLTYGDPKKIASWQTWIESGKFWIHADIQPRGIAVLDLKPSRARARA